jgi:hypothetical protein
MNDERPTLAEIREQESSRYMDRFINLNIGLWNAIAAIDGLFISAAAIIVAVNPQAGRGPFVLIIGCSIASLLGIIYNFYAARQTHYFLAAPGPEHVLTAAEMAKYERAAAKEKKKALHRYKYMRYSEMLCFGLLVIVITVFVYLVTQNKQGGNLPLQMESPRTK